MILCVRTLLLLLLCLGSDLSLSLTLNAQDVVWLGQSDVEATGRDRMWFLSDGTIARGRLLKNFSGRSIWIHSGENSASIAIALNQLGDDAIPVLKEELGAEYQVYVEAWEFIGDGYSARVRTKDRKYGDIALPNANPIFESNDRVLFSVDSKDMPLMDYASVAKSVIPPAELATLFAEDELLTTEKSVEVFDVRLGKKLPMEVAGEDDECFYVGWPGRYSKLDKGRFDQKSVTALSRTLSKQKASIPKEERDAAYIVVTLYDGTIDYLDLKNLTSVGHAIGYTMPGGEFLAKSFIDYHSDDLRFMAKQLRKVNPSQDAKSTAGKLDVRANQNEMLLAHHPYRELRTKYGFKLLKARLLKEVDSERALMLSPADELYILDLDKVDLASRSQLQADIDRLKNVSPDEDTYLRIDLPKVSFFYGAQSIRPNRVLQSIGKLPSLEANQFVSESLVKQALSYAGEGEDLLESRCIVEFHLATKQPIEDWFKLPLHERANRIRNQRLLGYWSSIGVSVTPERDGKKIFSNNDLFGTPLALVGEDYLVGFDKGVIGYKSVNRLSAQEKAIYADRIRIAAELASRFGFPEHVKNWLHNGLNIHRLMDSHAVYRLTTDLREGDKVITVENIDHDVMQLPLDQLSDYELDMLQVDRRLDARREEFLKAAEGKTFEERLKLLESWRRDVVETWRVEKLEWMARAKQAELALAEQMKVEKDAAKAAQRAAQQAAIDSALIIEQRINTEKEILAFLQGGVASRPAMVQDTLLQKFMNPAASGADSRKDLWTLNNRAYVIGNITEHIADGYVFESSETGETHLLFENQLDAASLEKLKSLKLKLSPSPRTFTRFLTTAGRQVELYPHEIIDADDLKMVMKFPHLGVQEVDTQNLDSAFRESLVAYFERQRTGQKADPQFNSKFSAPIAASERIEKIPDLDQEYRYGLQAITDFIPPTLDAATVSTVESTLVCLSADGSQVVLKNDSDSLSVIEVDAKKQTALPDAFRDGDIIGIIRGKPSLLCWHTNTLTVFNYLTGKVERDFDFAKQNTQSVEMSGNGAFAFLVDSSGAIFRIGLNDNTLVKLSSPELRDLLKVVDLLTDMSGESCYVYSSQRKYFIRVHGDGTLEVNKIESRGKTSFPPGDCLAGLTHYSVASTFGLTAVELRNHTTFRLPNYGKPLAVVQMETAAGPRLRTVAKEIEEYRNDEFLMICDPDFGHSASVKGTWSEDSRLSADGKRVFYHQDNQLVYSDIPTFQKPYVEVWEKVVSDMLKTEDIGQIEAFAREILQKRRDDDRTIFGNHYSTYVNIVTKYSYQLDSIQGGDLSERNFLRLERWHDRFPQSNVIRCCYARYLIAMAWEARGTGFASQVTEEGWEQFQLYINRAGAVIGPALRAGDVDEEIAEQAIEILKATGYTKKRLMGIISGAISNRCGYSPFVHMAASECLLPRWHGEIGELEEYCELVASKLGKDAGDRMYLYCVSRTVGYYNGPITDFHDFDMERVARGAQVALDANIDLNVVKLAIRILQNAKRDDLADLVIARKKSMPRIFMYEKDELIPRVGLQPKK